MDGIIRANETLLNVSGIVGLGLSMKYPSPTFAPFFIMVSVSLLAIAALINKHNAYIIKNTLNMRVKHYDMKQNWSATIRTDRIADPDYVCVYVVFYTVSRDEAESIQHENVITYTGETRRVQEEEIKETNISCNWIGKNGEEGDSNWKNKFATCIKHGKNFRISIIGCGYLRQEHI